MSPETPAAVLEQGTTAFQRSVVGNLETLPCRGAEAGIQTPAIIVVGGVCACQERFAWREKLPLFGCRAVVTRPRERAGTLATRLRTLGAEVLEVPAIATVPLEGVPGWEDFLAQLEKPSWLVFTSGRGVELFLEKSGPQAGTFGPFARRAGGHRPGDRGGASKARPFCRPGAPGL